MSSSKLNTFYFILYFNKEVSYQSGKAMSRSSTPPSPNRYSVLPPVAKSEVDRVFIRELQHYIDTELEEIGDSVDRKQRYIIHSAAFSKVSISIYYAN